MEYWDKDGNIYDTEAQKKSIQERAYNKLLANFADVDNADLVMGGIALGLPMTKVKYLPELIHATRLIYHKPFDKMTIEEKKSFGNLGKEYYKKYVQHRPVHNEDIGTIDFNGGQAGKPDYIYMEQYPKLRENIQNATENVYIKAKPRIDKNGNKYTRQDAVGFDNLKVNWKGKDYDYQIRHNPALENPDFYNIKPYDLLIKELENQTKGTP